MHVLQASVVAKFEEYIFRALQLILAAARAHSSGRLSVESKFILIRNHLNLPLQG